MRLNAGRPGARLGPAAFRAALARFGSVHDASLQRPISVRVFDAGDVVPAPGGGETALHETHTRITEALLAVHRAGLVPVCIGGGHDLTFPAVRALALHARSESADPALRLGGINIDAHTDVRETVGSGMPFRALIEHGLLDPAHFVELGLGRFTNAPEHVSWLAGRQTTLITIDTLRGDAGGALVEAAFSLASLRTKPPADPRPAFFSFDLDALDGSLAPGVSAVNPDGLAVPAAVHLVEMAARNPFIRHFDFMELCPPHDDPPFDPCNPVAVGRTARIAALLFIHLVSAFADRSLRRHGDSA